MRSPLRGPLRSIVCVVISLSFHCSFLTGHALYIDKHHTILTIVGINRVFQLFLVQVGLGGLGGLGGASIAELE